MQILRQIEGIKPKTKHYTLAKNAREGNRTLIFFSGFNTLRTSQVSAEFVVQRTSVTRKTLRFILLFTFCYEQHVACFDLSLLSMATN